MRQKITLAICTSFIGLFAQTQEQEQFCLNNNVDYVTGKYPYSIIAHDFTGDGILDYAAVSTAPFPVDSENVVRIMAGNGDGTFAPLAGNPVNAVGSNPLFMTQADYNEDGIPDIVTSNDDGNSISILLGTGGGYFSPATSIAIPLGVWPAKGVASADFNLDSHQDLVISANGKFIIALGDGSGTFTLMAPVNSYGRSQEVFVGNFNADAYPDVAISSIDSGRIIVILSTGPATFAAPAYYLVGEYPLSIDGADFNEDGYTDLFVTDTTSEGVWIIFGTATGAFTASAPIDVFDFPANGIALDANNDGHQDIAVTTGNDLEVFLGDGAGNFDAPMYFSSGQYAGMDVASGDLDNNGSIDVISSYYNDGAFDASNIAVFLNCTMLSTDAFTNSQISFYPNPTAGIVYIRDTSDGAVYTATIFDLQGRKISENKIESGAIDISALPSGMYFMQYRSHSMKIVKQ
ncbi:MAG TPA: T9SS type A sorting domain-containing protein [Flavobacterium sp.]|nr:T9SS type A sorting domain-containing protein [Flavobacterium sp.]